ncbi:MAG: tetraacyldisaccharide 4'-kinase [Magnetococcales bacterium]|nr:tetraacyldisaccharide 4'-kinase [Magnetococcales bacterium]
MQPLIPYLNGQKQPDTLLIKGILAALTPIGRIHHLIHTLRAQGYRRGILPAYDPPCPVVSVGNLTSGGTGKTPTALWIARHLMAQGWRVAVISRGYRQQSQAPVNVIAHDGQIHITPPQAADEAFLLAHLLPGATILTGPKRRLLIEHAVNTLQVEIVVMDDGFQHLQVRRHLDLLLLDGHHPFGNGHLLPRGHLREPLSALTRCDAILITRSGEGEQLADIRGQITQLAPDKPLLTTQHAPSRWSRLTEAGPVPREPPSQTPLHAFCGIGQPNSFFGNLKNLGFTLTATESYPDHHPYSREDIQGLSERAERSGAGGLVCTEKDGVKIDPGETKLPVFTLGVELIFQEEPHWLTHALAHLAKKNKGVTG